MRHFIFICFLLLTAYSACSQKATITEGKRQLITYPFSDPNPVPILTQNDKIYPYFTYEGYSHDGKQQDWKVITLENEHIEVFVLPEVGGKVWGAIDKSNDEEFIYRNEVMKFRNISMRGPWTSGGIEFNFGLIGHHPSTATPVDYVIQEHENGSVSCTVGNIDLPSRTQWRVTILLEKDKSAFETKAVWFNPSAMNQSYYNWMTAAAPARADFEFFTPGDKLLKHSGQALPWPIDNEGRNLALYKENNFGPSKSYHVVGEYNDFFGGYYHDANYGFGHWGEYEAIPGQKLWLWALSRSGGIWEDLLTDTDGQYIEFQAGRQFLQYSPGDHLNPQTQANFEPYSLDQWTELWFPVKDIGGLTDVSNNGVMAIENKDDTVHIRLHSFTNTTASIQFKTGESFIKEDAISFIPMEMVTREFAKSKDANFTISVPELDLHYTLESDDLHIDRPFETEVMTKPQTNEALYNSAWEDMKFREYADAENGFDAVIETDPHHIMALNKLAELHYRKGNYKEGLSYVNHALQLDTYHPESNYQAAIIYRAMGDYVNAKESFGWAARSMQFRSNAYTQLAEILLAEEKFENANIYARKALHFNQFNLNAWQVIAIVARKTNENDMVNEAIGAIEKIDPINHFSRFERYLHDNSDATLNTYLNANQSELAYQTYLELAINYWNKHQLNTAIRVLEVAPNHPLIHIWLAYISQDPEHPVLRTAMNQSPDFVFPFRRESLGALAWVNQHVTDWKFRYYYALNLWAKGRKKESSDILLQIGDEPGNPVFYLARARMLQEYNARDGIHDLQLAMKYGNDNWRCSEALTNYYIENEEYAKGLTIAKQSFSQFPQHYSLGMKLANLLNKNELYAESIDLLSQLKVLPFEGASEGRRLYETAHYYEALNQIDAKEYDQAILLLNKSKDWPEELGVGKPYDLDERIPNYLIGIAEYKRGNLELANRSWKEVLGDGHDPEKESAALLLSLKAEQYILGLTHATEHLHAILETPTNTSVLNWVASRFLQRPSKDEDIEARYLDLIQRIADLDVTEGE